MAISIGMILGAWITVLYKNNWKKAFIFCGFIFLSLSISLFLIPQKYFSTKYMIVEEQKISGNLEEKIVLTKEDSNEIKIKKNIKNINDIKFIENERKNSSKKIITKKEEKDDKNENEEKKQKLNNLNMKDENIIKNTSFVSKLKLVFINRCFIFSCISKAIIFFIFEIIYIIKLFTISKSCSKSIFH